MEKLAAMPVPDMVHNWLLNYFHNRSHFTRFNNTLSQSIAINASFAQGGGLGPICYSLNSIDLHPKTEHNDFIKYADDIYLVVPSQNSATITSEIDALKIWAKLNNLNLNHSKTQEMVIFKQGTKIVDRIMPEEIDGIARVPIVKILGVYIDDKLTFNDHVSRISSAAASSLYALKLLRSKGLKEPSLWDITSQTLVTRLLYAFQAWSGFLTKAALQQLNAIIHRAKKQSLLPRSYLGFDELCQKADQTLFRVALNNQNHVLYHLFPPTRDFHYNLRPRAHDRKLPKIINNRDKQLFTNRMLYRDIY